MDEQQREQQRLREQLPDYLTGRADAADAARIAALVAADPAWADDVAGLRALRAAVQAEAAAMDGADGLAALRARIARADVAARPQRSDRGLWQRMRAFMTLSTLAPVTVVLLAGVVGVQAWMLTHAPTPASDVSGAGTPQVRWRGGPLDGLTPAGTLKVTLAYNVSVTQFEAALAQAQARIVGGPLADHSYLLDAADPGAALRSLRANPIVADVRALAPAR